MLSSFKVISILINKKDALLQVPNGFGSGLGAIQLILYAIYRDKGKKRGKGDEGPSQMDSIIELGSASKPLPPTATSTEHPK